MYENVEFNLIQSKLCFLEGFKASVGQINLSLVKRNFYDFSYLNY